MERSLAHVHADNLTLCSILLRCIHSTIEGNICIFLPFIAAQFFFRIHNEAFALVHALRSGEGAGLTLSLLVLLGRAESLTVHRMSIPPARSKVSGSCALDILFTSSYSRSETPSPLRYLEYLARIAPEEHKLFHLLSILFIRFGIKPSQEQEHNQCSEQCGMKTALSLRAALSQSSRKEESTRSL
jgi:hypothetical protein